MAIAGTQMTFDAYLAYNDGTDRRYELVNGELVPMPPESRINARIALFLVAEFLKFVPYHLICCKDTEIEVSGKLASARLPDVMILSAALDDILGGARSTITRDMPPPRLVVEIVSPGKENEDRDYRYKRSEYAAREIEEYWIVDPIAQKITVLTWVDGLYEDREFQGAETLQSQVLSDWSVTVEQVLGAGR